MTNFQIYPAVDLKDGNCVRLVHGKENKMTIYEDDPIKQVKYFSNKGFKWVHIVDLNAAKTGGNENLKIIKDIANIEDLEIQVGGGIRTIDKAKDLISNNVKKIIVGTAAIKDIKFRNDLKENINVENIIFGLDFNIVKNSPLLSVDGWTNNTNINLFDYIDENLWIQNILATDISLDGTLQGPNLNIYKNLLNCQIIFHFNHQHMLM